MPKTRWPARLKSADNLRLGRVKILVMGCNSTASILEAVVVGFDTERKSQDNQQGKWLAAKRLSLLGNRSEGGIVAMSFSHLTPIILNGQERVHNFGIEMAARTKANAFHRFSMQKLGLVMALTD